MLMIPNGYENESSSITGQSADGVRDFVMSTSQIAASDSSLLRFNLSTFARNQAMEFYPGLASYQAKHLHGAMCHYVSKRLFTSRNRTTTALDNPEYSFVVLKYDLSQRNMCGAIWLGLSLQFSQGFGWSRSHRRFDRGDSIGGQPGFTSAVKEYEYLPSIICLLDSENVESWCTATKPGS